MGIQIEFNPDLALRCMSEYEEGRRRFEECIPEKLEFGKTYYFLKKGQRNYWLEGEIPLVETKGNQELSRPLASVIILSVTHYLEGNESYTKGQYVVVDVFNPEDPEIHFEGLDRIH